MDACGVCGVTGCCCKYPGGAEPGGIPFCLVAWLK